MERQEEGLCFCEPLARFGVIAQGYLLGAQCERKPCCRTRTRTSSLCLRCRLVFLGCFPQRHLPSRGLCGGRLQAEVALPLLSFHGHPGLRRAAKEEAQASDFALSGVKLVGSVPLFQGLPRSPLQLSELVRSQGEM